MTLRHQGFSNWSRVATDHHEPDIISWCTNRNDPLVVRHDDRRSWGILTRRFLDRRVDPDGGRQIGRLRRSVHEAFGVRHVRGGQHDFTMRAHGRGLAEVHDRRRQEPEPAVMMVVVVPAKERLAERAAIGDRSEAVRKRRTVFERPELGFRKWIVVGPQRLATLTRSFSAT